MEELERQLRWAFYFDYGTSPERYWESFKYESEASFYASISGCTEDQMKASHFMLSINQFLRIYKTQIISDSKKFGIDGRAVAAVVTWEFEQNLKGRRSDYVQMMKPGSTSGIGWGSMHTQEALNLAGDTHSLREVACLRMDANTVIPMIAEFIKKCIDRYYKKSKGLFIGHDVPVMAIISHRTK